MRSILAAAVLALSAVEAPAEAQQTAKVVKIGFVAPQGGSLPLSIVVDPVADNVVPSFERLGERITGVTSFDPRQATKQFELLKELIPGLRLTGPTPDLEAAFAAIKQGQANAILVLEEPILGVHATKIAELAAKSHLPSLFPPSRVAAGGLIAYGTSQTEAIRRMAGYIDKILKGAKPSNLPVEAVTRYELFVNLKTAKQIGISVPASLLERANRVLR